MRWLNRARVYTNGKQSAPFQQTIRVSSARSTSQMEATCHVAVHLFLGLLNANPSCARALPHSLARSQWVKLDWALP